MNRYQYEYFTPRMHVHYLCTRNWCIVVWILPILYDSRFVANLRSCFHSVDCSLPSQALSRVPIANRLLLLLRVWSWVHGRRSVKSIPSKFLHSLSTAHLVVLFMIRFVFVVAADRDIIYNSDNCYLINDAMIMIINTALMVSSPYFFIWKL